jgi:hypothetical protein
VSVDAASLLPCCFPTAITFNVRAGNQWAVVGDLSGFLHHVVADAATGVCRNNCDGNFQRMNGRLTSTLYSPGQATLPTILDRLPDAIDPSPSFMNPMFRFGIALPKRECTAAPACATGTGISTSSVFGCLAGICTAGRDTQFRFTTNQSFAPLLVSLSTDAQTLVEPTSVTYLPATQEVAITDGSLSGLIMMSLQTGTYSRSFF